MFRANLVEDVDPHGQFITKDVDAIKRSFTSRSHMRIRAINVQSTTNSKACCIFGAAFGKLWNDGKQTT